MAWYDPRSWFSSASADTSVETPTAEAAPAPLGGPYGGKKSRKTRRAKKAASKRGRTGKKSSRS